MKKYILIYLLSSLSSFCSVVYGEEKLTVYYKETIPYLTVYDNYPIGAGINIINRYIISNNINVTYIQVDNIKSLLYHVKIDKNSVGIGAISINIDRLNDIKFTLPYRITTTVLAYNNSLSLDSILSQLAKILYAFKPFLILVLLVSFILTLTKMKFINALYLSFVTSTTVGYGDIVPKGFSQKSIMILWMLISTYFLSLFTSVLTVSLNNNVNYIPYRVGVINQSEGNRICQIKQYNCIGYDTIDDMILDFKQSIIDGIIQDKEIIEQYDMDVKYKTLTNSMHAIITNQSYNNDKINKFIKF